MDMQDYVRLVLAEVKKGERPRIYEAPPFVTLRPGDLVVVEGTPEAHRATVVDTMVMNTRLYKDEIAFVLNCAGVTRPLPRVEGVFKYKDVGDDWCDWATLGDEDGDEDGEEDGE